MKFDKELEVARSAALKAGEIIMASYNRISEHDVDEKGRNDFVTVVDRNSQQVILDAIRAAFPKDFIVAEESLPAGFNDGAESHRRWYIDPLDGTTNYIHAYPHFAVTIALEVGGELTVAVTYSPIYRETYHAIRGEGAFLNGARIRVSRYSEDSRIMLGTGFPFRARHLLDIYLKSFALFFNRARGVRRGGSAALDLAYVAAGRLDGFWELTLFAVGHRGGCPAGGRGGRAGHRFLRRAHVSPEWPHHRDQRPPSRLDARRNRLGFPRDGDYSKRS
jgi:myo-inositol-1(or 4)-monophosphatase